MITSRAQGHFVGKVLVFVSLGFLSFALTIAEHVAVPIACAALSGVAGAYFLKKLYLDDPEAVAEYRNKLGQQRMRENLREFGSIANMLKLVGQQDLAKLIDADIGSDRLSPWLTQMGAVAIADLVQHGVYSRMQVFAMFAEEVKFHSTFTSLWTSGLAGEMPALHRLGVVDVDACRALLLAEYDWVSESGDLQASAPPRTSPAGGAPSGGVPGAAIGVFAAMLQYGGFAMEVLGVKKAFLVTVCETCSFAIDHPCSDLVREGLVELGRCGLLSKTFIERKVVQQLQGDCVSNLWAAEELLKLSLLLEHHLIDPRLVAALFAAAIPIHSCIGQPTEKSNVVCFMRYWRVALELHAALLVPHHLLRPMHLASQEFHLESARIERDCTIPRDAKSSAPPQIRRQEEAEWRARRADALRSLEAAVHERFVAAAEAPSTDLYWGSASASTCEPM